MARFKVGDAVVLLADRPEDGLKSGDLGAIVLEYDTPTVAYETEFCDEDGRTTAQVALLPEEIGPYDAKPRSNPRAA